MAKIKVRLNSTGQTGTVDDSEFDPNIYTSLEEPKKGRSLLASVLPILGGIGGGIVGAAGGPVGVVAGGAAGAGLGESVAQGISGEQLDVKKIGLNAAMGGVPFGRGAGFVSKFLLPGAGVGALGALQDENATPTSVATNAVVGAGAAGIGGPLLGKIFGKGEGLVAQGAGGLEKSVINPKVPASIYGASNTDEVLASFKDPLVSKFFKSGSAAAKYRGLQPAFEAVDTQITKKLTGKTIPTSTVLDTFDDAISKNIRLNNSDVKAVTTMRDNLTNQFLNTANKGKTGIKITDKTLYEFKKDLNKQLGRTFDKLEKGGDITDAEEMALEMWGTIDGLLPTSVNRLTRLQSNLIKSAPGLKQSSERNLRVPIVGNIPFINKPVQEIMSGVAKKGTALTNEYSNLSKVLGGTEGQARIGALAASGMMNGGGDTQTPALTQAGVLPGQESVAPQQERSVSIKGQMVTESQLRQAYIEDLAAGGKNKTLFEGILKAAFPEGDLKPFSVKAAEDSATVESGINALSEVSKIISEDPSVLTKQLLPGKFVSRKWDSALFRTVEAILRLRTGAAAPESEVRRYMGKFAPSFGDDPETIQFKLEQLAEDFNNYKVNLESTRGTTDLQNLSSSLSQ